MSIIWRPNLFSATGASFQTDATVQDGIHLRWMIDPRLGLPFEKNQHAWGGFMVYEQQTKFPCIEKATLDDIRLSTPIPVHSLTDVNADYRIQVRNNATFFLHSRRNPANIAAEQLLNQVRTLNLFRVMEEHRPFPEYLSGIARAVKGETPFLQPAFQIGEVCAIDMTFARGTGTVPGSDPTQNNGCLGVFSALAEKRYAWIRAYDANDNMLIEDWIGLHAFNSAHIGNMAARNKFSLRLRAPGIHHVSIDPIAGQPVMDRTIMQWVFCEEYCNAPVWRLISKVPTRFNGNPEAYSPVVLQNQYYEPFKKTFDWTQLLNTWINRVVLSPEVITLLDATNTFDMYNEPVVMETPPGPGSLGLARISMITAMLQSAIDPAVASLIGLYAHYPEQNSERDIRIVAKLPFFESENLDELHEKFKKFCTLYNTPYNLRHHLGWHDAERRFDVQLGSLVLGPIKGPKESPSTPAGETTVTSIDLPAEDGSTVLLVQSTMQIIKPPFSMLPYRNVTSFEVERSIGGGAFENAVQDDISDPLEQIGILPPVFFPGDGEDSAHITVRDSFSLTLPTDTETLQYRSRSFDIFARPSDWKSHDAANIPFPCHPPLPPANLSATVIVKNGQLWVELFISVAGETKVLQAVPKELEICIHTIDGDAPGEVGDIRWAGDRNSRAVTLLYAGNYPDTVPAISCVNLNWGATQLNWNAAAPGSCDPVYPPDVPVVESVADPLMPASVANFKTYRIQIPLAVRSALAAGDHFWCSRARIKGECADGDVVYSRESCSSFRYNMVLPPPPVIQPVGSIIPESTFADKKGNSYYSVYLNALLPPVPPGGEMLANIYIINLQNLKGETAGLVEGKNLLPGAHPVLLQLARANKSPFRKVNTTPVPVTADHTWFPVAVEGDIENYFVLGIVGTNPQYQESTWDKAAILIFKTPKPVPKPTIRFSAIRSFVNNNEVVAEISFRSDIAVVADAADVVPVIQVKRFDHSTVTDRFLGEVRGTWNETAECYDFNVRDTRLTSWRKYAYEAALVSLSEGKWVLSDARATAEILAPGLPSAAPLGEAYPATITPSSSGNELRFECMIGNFDFSLTRMDADGNRQQFTGEIKNNRIIGLPGATLSLHADKKNYIIQWTDTTGGDAEYTFRVGIGQQRRWSKKIKTP